jgi:hypothetical protein
MDRTQNQPAEAREEFVTIIAPTMSAVMAEFKARDLAALGYAIVGRAGWHRFQVAEGQRSSELFDGRQMLAATFRRPHAAA